MSQFTLELQDLDTGYILEPKFLKKVTKAESFKAECKKAAEIIYKKNKKSGIILYLENSYESLVLLESFLDIGAKFEVATLSCGQVSSTVVTKWKSKLEQLGIPLHDIRFDYENNEHTTAVEALQKQFDTVKLLSLFKIWLACQFDQFVVFPGDFCIPEIDSTNKISSWGLPNAGQVAFYNFSKSFELEPFFLCSTHGIFKAQIESDFTAAYIHMNSADARGFEADYFAARKIFFENCGVKRVSGWPVTEEAEPIWKAGLRFEARAPHEIISRIINRSRQVQMQNIELKHHPELATPKKFDKRKEKMAHIYRELKKLSTDLVNTGAITLVSKNKNDRVYAAFPQLFTDHIFEGDLSKELEFVKQIPFYPNMKNLISGNDLHLKPELSRLSEFFYEKIQKYFEIQGFIVNEFEIMQCWANRSKAYMDHHPHKHPNSIVSGVFYFNDGDGDTEFIKETPESDVIRPTASKTTVFNSRFLRIRPEFGKLILFPSHLNHQVLLHQSTTEDRITIAFNVFIRGVIGEFNEGAWVDLRPLTSKK